MVVTVRVDLVILIASYRLGMLAFGTAVGRSLVAVTVTSCRHLAQNYLHSYAQHNNDHGVADPVNYHVAERITTRVFRHAIHM